MIKTISIESSSICCSILILWIKKQSQRTSIIVPVIGETSIPGGDKINSERPELCRERQKEIVGTEIRRRASS